jgi:hypothetical protein
VPTDLSPTEWTRQIGYLYPPEIFQAALRATFPSSAHSHGRTTPLEQACFGEYVNAREMNVAGSGGEAWLVLSGEKQTWA